MVVFMFLGGSKQLPGWFVAHIYRHNGDFLKLVPKCPAWPGPRVPGWVRGRGCNRYLGSAQVQSTWTIMGLWVFPNKADSMNLSVTVQRQIDLFSQVTWNSKVLENQDVIPNVQCPGCPWDHPPPIPTIPFSWSRWGRECLAKCCQNAGISKTFLEDLSKMLWGPTKVIIYLQKVIIPPKKCALIPQNRSINHLTTLIILKKYLRHFVEKCRFRWVGGANQFCQFQHFGNISPSNPSLSENHLSSKSIKGGLGRWSDAWSMLRQVARCSFSVTCVLVDCGG